jgi:hypothetical protein
MKPPLNPKYTDNIQTPDEALFPLLPYLKEEWIIWECAKGKGNLVRALERFGFKVVGTDILDGLQYDFLSYKLDNFDCIITNPPYSKKNDFLKRAYSFKKPFAFLLPLTIFEGRIRQKLFKENGVEVIFMNKRINFEMPFNKGTGSWFMTAWFTHGLNIGKEISFYNFDELKL